MLITWHIFPVSLIFPNSDRTLLCFHRPTHPTETTLGVLFLRLRALGILLFFFRAQSFSYFPFFSNFTLQTSWTKSLQLCRRRNGCYSRGTKSNCYKSDGRSWVVCSECVCSQGWSLSSAAHIFMLRNPNNYKVSRSCECSAANASWLSNYQNYVQLKNANVRQNLKRSRTWWRIDDRLW